jgi:hypothetical protein
MARIQQLRPSTFDLKTSDAKLSCMAMMHALGDEYKHFTSSLALLTDLDKDKVKVAFQTEEINRRPRPDASPTSALSTSIPTCRCDPSSSCAFCDKAGHCQCKCYALQRAKETFKSSKHSGRRPNQANTTSATPGTPSTTSTAATANVAAQDVAERAGNASLRSIDPCDALSPLQLDADVDWNADTGATSHMTPHRHWLRNYTPKRIPIKLALCLPHKRPCTQLRWWTAQQWIGASTSRKQHQCQSSQCRLQWSDQCPCNLHGWRLSRW